MSLNRRAAKRDDNEGEIIAGLIAAGCTVKQISLEGFPDLIVGRHGVNYLLEVKTAKGKLTAEQEVFFEDWCGQVQVVRTVEEALLTVGL